MENKIFKRSLSEFKSVKNICIMSLLMAIILVLRMFVSIKINEYLQIRFDFLIFIISGAMFGPAFAFLFGFLADIVLFYVNGGGGNFHFGFTLCSILSALMYGIFLYKYKLGVVRTVILQIVHDIIICFLLNTYWLSSMNFNGNFKLAFFSRLPKECLMLPIRCAMAVAIVLLLKRVVVGLKLTKDCDC